jgi:hypothetical protein
VVVTSGTTLDIGGGTLTVAGSFLQNGGGRLQMTNPAGVLTVVGNAQFQDTDMGDTSLTAGTLVLQGNLTAPSSGNGQPFRGAGTHTTRLAGAGNQTVSFVYPADDQSRFQNLEVTNTAGTVTFSSEAVIRGSLTVAAGATLVRSGSLYVGGQVTTAAGSSLSSVSVLGIYVAGAPLPLIQGLPPVEVRLQGGGTTDAPAGSRTVPTRLVITSGTVLDIGPDTVFVTGSFLQAGGGRLAMNDPAGLFDVTGDAQFQDTDMGNTSLTAGTLALRGNLSAPSSGNGQPFRAAGSHLTRFAGSGPQSVSFFYPNPTESRFQHVEVTNTGGAVTFLQDHYANGNLTVGAGAAVVRTGVLYVVGQATSAATGSLSGVSTLAVYGNSAPLPLIQGPPPGEVRMQGGGTTPALVTGRTLPTRLVLTGGTVLDVGSDTLTVTGSFLQTGGLLRMNGAQGLLTIQGNAQFEGVDLGDTNLTAGTLVLQGNLTAPSSGNGQPFRAVGSHLTRLSGTGPQTVSFFYPGAGQSRFQDLDIDNPSVGGVSLGSNAFVAGNLSQLGRLSVATTFTVSGTVSLGPTSTTTVTGALLKSACVILPGAPGAVFSGFICP